MSTLNPHEIVHKCEEFTYEYIEIFWEESSQTWNIDIDYQGFATIYYCPFCGDYLGTSKDNTESILCNAGR